jgi:Undecaprenyl-phosphate galactose phosphotransferase WbaP
MVQSIWGRGTLSEITVVAVVPTIVAWIGLRALLGLYRGYGLGRVEELRRATYAVFVAAALTAIFAVAFQVGHQLSRLLLVSILLGLLVLAPPVRNLTRWVLRTAGLWGKPAVILGAGKFGARITSLLQENWELGYKPVAVYDYRPAPREGAREDKPHEKMVSDASALSRKQGVDTVIFAMPHVGREHLAELVGLASAKFRHVLIIPNLGSVTNSAVAARDLAGTFAVEIKYNLLDPWARRVKRGIDLCVVVAGGAIISPLILLLALLIYLEAGAPIFYRDWRMGRDGNLFSCVKFRTMVPEAEALLQRMLEEDAGLREEYSRYHKLRRDPRVTRIGRLLRKTSLDELPQLWHVLRGEMSLVGPRPYLPRESEEVGLARSEILRVPPGITGPWQVAGRNHASFGDRVEKDAYYVRDWSVWLDLVILARTVKVVVMGRGAC